MTISVLKMRRFIPQTVWISDMLLTFYEHFNLKMPVI